MMRWYDSCSHEFMLLVTCSKSQYRRPLRYAMTKKFQGQFARTTEKQLAELEFLLEVLVLSWSWRFTIQSASVTNRRGNFDLRDSIIIWHTISNIYRADNQRCTSRFSEGDRTKRLCFLLSQSFRFASRMFAQALCTSR
jgi:hypothetical protein